MQILEARGIGDGGFLMSIIFFILVVQLGIGFFKWIRKQFKSGPDQRG